MFLWNLFDNLHYYEAWKIGTEAKINGEPNPYILTNNCSSFEDQSNFPCLFVDLFWENAGPISPYVL